MNYNFLQNKNILITGGTGTLGRKLVRHLVKNEEPETVRIFDVDETEQFEFHNELKEYEDTVQFLLGDVRDKERLAGAVEDVDIIFHTAALKHVMACEYNPFEATNYLIKSCQYTENGYGNGIMIKHKILALIPACGGSKGIPRKNIRQLAGKPLITWSIESSK